jgi:pilus assembly protein CpaD
MARTPSALLALIAMTGLSGCAGGTSDPAIKARQLDVQLERTLLDNHVPKPVPVEARLAVGMNPGATFLDPSERAQVQLFATEFARLGRGAVVVSIPANAANSGAAQVLAQDVQRALFAAGVDFQKIAGGAYQAAGQAHAPIVLSFARYEVAPVQCTPWSQVDPRETADNLVPERFGCAQAANLSAMLADPGDLLGDRAEPPKDAERIQPGVDARSKGQIKGVSGAVGGR